MPQSKIGNPGDQVLPELSRGKLATLGRTPAKVQENYNDIFRKFTAEREDITGFFSGLS